MLLSTRIEHVVIGGYSSSYDARVTSGDYVIKLQSYILLKLHTD